MKKVSLLLFLLPFFLFNSCGDDDIGSASSWSIPISEVFQGGPGKDGIPSVDSPVFSSVGEIDFMAEEDLIIGIKVGNEVRGYPHPVLDWHEIVNDKIGNLGVAITYCPLTGTAIGWNRMVAGEETTFGVSGLLYNSNLIPYDRASDSNWTQMGLECVNGDLVGETPDNVPLIETTWSTWKTMYPESQVLNTSTGFSRSYGTYPYGDYKTTENLLFNVSPDDDRLSRKERVLGVLEGDRTRAYRFSSFNYSANGRALLEDELNGQALLLVASQDENFIAAFERPTTGEYSLVEVGGAAILEDAAGNQYDFFGKVIAGSGADLVPAYSFIGYWFSWGAFYPGVEIFNR